MANVDSMVKSKTVASFLPRSYSWHATVNHKPLPLIRIGRRRRRDFSAWLHALWILSSRTLALRIALIAT